MKALVVIVPIEKIPNSVDTQVFAIGHKSESYDTSGTQIDANLHFHLIDSEN